MATSKKSPQTGKDVKETTLLLLANGSSGPWDIAVDETAGKPERLFAHIEGPSVYLYFNIPSAKTIAKALHFLKQRCHANGSHPQKKGSDNDSALQIGTFGRAAINLVWDDEYLDRCFLIVGVSNKPSFRLTLSGEEIGHLVEALQQVQSDLEDAGLLSI
jgi:hypothetical protein